MAAARPPGEERRRLPRARRITRSAEIRSILSRGKRSGTAHLDVFDFASPSSSSRVGLIVPRYGRSAVDRNRLKRRLREMLRLAVLPRLDRCSAGLDVLVRTRPGAYGAPAGALRMELEGWTERRCSRGSSSA